MSDNGTLTAESAEEYTHSLSQIFAGSYRQILWAHREGIPAALGLTTEQWVKERLGGYVRMEIPERREAVAELTDEGLSTREIGDVLGVSKDTVRNDLTGENSPPVQDRPVEALEESAGRDPRVRHTRALKSLADATYAVSKVNVALDDVAEAVTHDDRDKHAADIRRSIETWERLLGRIEESQSLRRVK